MSAVAVDPRIRARRISVARDAGRRRLRRLGVIVAVLVAGLAALALTWTPLLDVDELQIVGADRTSVEAVTAAADLQIGDPLVWLDPGEAERAVRTLPWVEDAAVHRDWSGGVTIELTERVPAAAVARPDGGWLLADGEGRVLARVDEAPGDLPVADGVSVSARPGDTVGDAALGPLEVAGAMPAGLRAMAATIQGSGSSLEVALRAGGVVALGGPEDAGAKLAAASAVLATVMPGCVQRLDVSLPAAPALVRVPACA